MFDNTAKKTFSANETSLFFLHQLLYQPFKRCFWGVPRASQNIYFEVYAEYISFGVLLERAKNTYLRAKMFFFTAGGPKRRNTVDGAAKTKHQATV